ncbi:hypothetical protein GS501_01630 [Saccharibacter sp. 17.LH.SD]|uniref:hypothetical protein n=1 Tax=Saccharibacter sp. 17.LH.SD TaxID=2689393 RepID=UPI00136FC144|nr:hypothetical protein [Saccharibacter sp. 17.LH.SD]MXV43757.1 hypothetical protein [Saccharibacter sp. 17.LH.SD]
MTWDEPYLETCCRSALHRLLLSGDGGRPVAAPAGARIPDFRQSLKDRPCLERLQERGFARQREDGRFIITAEGVARHAIEIGGAKRRSR